MVEECDTLKTNHDSFHESKICCLLSLAVYVESSDIVVPKMLVESDGFDGPKFIVLYPEGHQKNRRMLNGVLDHPGFTQEKKERPAIYSIQKGPTTCCAKLCST